MILSEMTGHTPGVAQFVAPPADNVNGIYARL
jgi:hypothetical protein